MARALQVPLPEAHGTNAPGTSFRQDSAPSTLDSSRHKVQSARPQGQGYLPSLPSVQPEAQETQAARDVAPAELYGEPAGHTEQAAAPTPL